MNLGPETADKIAILGSAQSSTLLAPFNDPTWAIWCTSPGTFAQTADKRTDVWFELHRWLPSDPGKAGAPGTRPWFSPEFHQFLSKYQGPVFMTEKQPSIPKSEPFPYQLLLDKHGPYFFTSSISWMLAFALEQPIKAIAMFGVDMAANSEWAYQRPGCQHFLGLASQMGIEVVLPPESDLMQPSTMYGIGEHNTRHVKLSARLAELEAQKAQCFAAITNNTQQFKYLEGAVEATKYMLEVWCDDVRPSPQHAMSFSGAYHKKAESTGATVLDLARR